MARPKSYDRQEAVKRSCHAFWKTGFRALGVRALEAQTGLNQFAIRTEFGGKEGLFLEALAFYADAADATVLQPLRNGDINTIKTFFEGLVTKGSVNSSEYGCLIVNTGIENAELQSPRLEQAAAKYWANLAALFTAALNRSAKKGILKRDIHSRMVAQGLVTAVMGIHTMNRTKRAHNAGAPLVVMICDHLDGLVSK